MHDQTLYLDKNIYIYPVTLNAKANFFYVDICIMNIVKYLELLTSKCTNNPRMIYPKIFNYPIA